MGHRDFIRPFGNHSGEKVETAADAQRFDVAQAAGFDGGVSTSSYAPVTPIVIGGAGVQFNLSGHAITMTAGARTTKGGRFVHGDNDNTTLSVRTRTIVVPIVPAMQGDGDGLVTDHFGSPLLDPSLLAVTGIDDSGGYSQAIDRWLHHSATLSAVTVHVGTRAPFSIFSANLLRYDQTGAVVTVYSIGTTILTNPSVTPLAAPKPFALTYVGGIGTASVIDRSSYYYVLQLFGNAPTFFTTALLTLSDIVDLRGS